MPKIFNAKTQRCQGAKGLKTYAGDLEPHRLVNANGRLAPFGFNFAPWLLCVLALNSDCMVTAERAGAAGDGRGNSDKNSPQDAEATRVTLAWGASLLVEEPSESRMRENRPSGLMRAERGGHWPCAFQPVRSAFSTKTEIPPLSNLVRNFNRNSGAVVVVI